MEIQYIYTYSICALQNKKIMDDEKFHEKRKGTHGHDSSQCELMQEI